MFMTITWNMTFTSLLNIYI